MGSAIKGMNADLQKKLKTVQRCKRCKKEFSEFNNIMACQGKHLHVSGTELFRVCNGCIIL